LQRLEEYWHRAALNALLKVYSVEISEWNIICKKKMQ
jgi:hypothetical protein